MFLPSIHIDKSALLPRYFMPHQLAWIEAEAPFHENGRPVFALAEKSVRIGWTYADAFKNVRKRLRFKKRDYLFATKDYPSALEYMQLCYNFAGVFNLTRAVLSHGEDYLQVSRLGPDGQPTGFTDEIKIGLIKFDNGSRIIAFSSNPRAMAVHAGDVGLDEFAKHQNARLLWETAQGRVTWGFDMAVWSSHDGQDTLFHQFAREARLSCSADLQSAVSQSCTLQTPPTGDNPAQNVSTPAPEPPSVPHHESRISNHEPTPPTDTYGQLPTPASEPNQCSSVSIRGSTSSSPWNLYFHVTISDAIDLGLLDVINRVQNTRFTPEQFIADCRTRAGSEETFQQTYMCNPAGSGAASIVDWSAIERCRADYEIDRLHLESAQIVSTFGEFNPLTQPAREQKIRSFLHASFPSLFGKKRDSQLSTKNPQLRLGFDVAASGQGDLAVIYIDELRGGSELWLRALFSSRTEDWHFLKTALFCFMKDLRGIKGAGDESGLGRQICWEAASQCSGRFLKVNFSSSKNDLGFALMNQLSVSEKRFPREHQDIAADYFALRKVHNGSRWVFNEGPNLLNPASHCDIAWAGALATHAHTEQKEEVWAAVLHETCWFDGKDYHPYAK